MTNQEISEVFSLLNEAGWKPMVCDTPVPFYNNGVPAGPPNGTGDYDGDYLMLPRELVGYEPTFMIVVRGESMCGAGIENGDIVSLQATDNAEDGDIVVAWLDGEATLKVFYRDENGEAWLVPQNPQYQPIKMSEFSTARILGRVVDVKKSVGRVPFRQIQQQMRATKPKDVQQELTDEMVKRAVQRIVPKMSNSRQWFCVYRVLADKGYLHEHAFYELRECVNRLFPNNEYSINVKDISRMAVGSFDKRLFFWEEQTAPVQGKRYMEYLTLAQEFQKMLE